MKIFLYLAGQNSLAIVDGTPEVDGKDMTVDLKSDGKADEGITNNCHNFHIDGYSTKVFH